MFAAVPIAQHAVGRERRPVPSAARRQRNGDREGEHDDQHRRERELESRRDAQAEHVGHKDGGEHREADGRCDRCPRACEVGDVIAPDHRNGGRPEQHGGEEPAAGDRRRVFAQALANVGRDAARDGMAHAERRERDRERSRQDEQGGPGDDRRCARGLDGERGHEQKPGADQRTDVESRAPRDPELPHGEENAAAAPKRPTVLHCQNSSLTSHEYGGPTVRSE